MLQSCPISSDRINTNIIRGISLQVFIIAALLLFTENIVFAILLFYDFLVRVLRFQNFSPFYQISNFIVKNLHLKPKLSDDAPKQFARYLGLFMAFVILVLSFFSLDSFIVFIVGIMLVCASMEVLLDYCVGCEIYHIIQKIGKRK